MPAAASPSLNDEKKKKGGLVQSFRRAMSISTTKSPRPKESRDGKPL
jgi:hypothetical protein